MQVATTGLILLLVSRGVLSQEDGAHGLADYSQVDMLFLLLQIRQLWSEIEHGPLNSTP